MSVDTIKVDLNIMGGGRQWWIGGSGRSASPPHPYHLLYTSPPPILITALCIIFIPVFQKNMFCEKWKYCYLASCIFVLVSDIGKCLPWDWKSPGPSIIWGFVEVGSVKFRLLRGWGDCVRPGRVLASYPPLSPVTKTTLWTSPLQLGVKTPPRKV